MSCHVFSQECGQVKAAFVPRRCVNELIYLGPHPCTRHIPRSGPAAAQMRGNIRYKMVVEWPLWPIAGAGCRSSVFNYLRLPIIRPLRSQLGCLQTDYVRPVVGWTEASFAGDDAMENNRRRRKKRTQRGTC